MQNDSAASAPKRNVDTSAGDLDQTRRIRSEDILRGAREIVIDHDGRVYRLRITQNGKLILTA
jgi:hemin uptake protein HemP